MKIIRILESYDDWVPVEWLGHIFWFFIFWLLLVLDSLGCFFDIDEFKTFSHKRR